MTPVRAYVARMVSTSSQTGGTLTDIGRTASTSRTETKSTSQMPYAEYLADHGSVRPRGPSQTASTRYTSSSGRSRTAQPLAKTKFAMLSAKPKNSPAPAITTQPSMTLVMVIAFWLM